MIDFIREEIGVRLVGQYPWITIFFSFLLGGFFMPFVRKMAIRKNLVARTNRRTSHVGKVPNIGGMNIFFTFFVSFLFFAIPPVFFTTFTANELDSKSQFVLVGLLCIFFVGLMDDMLEISARKKFIGELIVAFIIVVMGDFRFTYFYGMFSLSDVSTEFVWLSYAASIFLFLLLTNAINLIDGVDGLATGLGILACLFYGIYFQLADELNLSLMAYTLIGALTVFFIYNVFGSRRKIFMGDSGSLLLGSVIYIFIVSLCQYNISLEKCGQMDAPLFMNAAPVVAFCTVAVPLFDTFRVMVTRIKNGRSPFLADKNHVHHLLLELGLTHRQVTLVLVLVNLSFIVLGLLGINFHNWMIGCIVVAYACSLTFLLWRVVDDHRLLHPGLLSEKKINGSDKK